VPIYCDVFDPDSCAAAVARCREALGPIDILVNNAAAGPYRPFERLSMRDFEVTFTANVRAPLVFAQLVAPDMRARRRGWMVNVPGVEALGATRWIEPSMTEPIEAIAEVALALATCDASLTGRVTYGLPLLRELAREIRTLDGQSLVDAER